MPDSIESIFERRAWNRTRGGPLYAQLRQHIEESIHSGRIGAGESLPSEREIADIADVSRVTVRKAVGDLVKDGLIVQRPGSGTSVAQQLNRVEQSLSRLTSFTEDMARRGRAVTSTWLDRGLFTPSPEETITLGLSADSLVARIARLRIADGVPLAIERASLSPEFVPDPGRLKHSLYALLDEGGNKPVRAIQRISARNLAAEDAALLDVPVGAAGLDIERISYLRSGKVVEFTRSIYRGDAYDFVAELQIGPSSAE